MKKSLENQFVSTIKHFSRIEFLTYPIERIQKFQNDMKSGELLYDGLSLEDKRLYCLYKLYHICSFILGDTNEHFEFVDLFNQF